MECVIVNKLERTIEYTNVCVYEQVKCEEINGKSFVSYIMGTLKVSGGSSTSVWCKFRCGRWMRRSLRLEQYQIKLEKAKHSIKIGDRCQSNVFVVARAVGHIDGMA